MSNCGIESQNQPFSRRELPLQERLDGFSDISLERGMYRVPSGLHTTNNNAYTPRLVSIGPLHHGKDSLRKLENQKLLYLKAFLTWTKMDLNHLMSVIKEKEDKLKRFYTPDTIEKFRGDSFVELILVDATFIVVLLLRTFFPGLFKVTNDYIFETGYVEAEIGRDLALLENQVPLFILLDLYDIITKSRGDVHRSFFNLALRFLRKVSLNKTKISGDINIISPEGDEVKHLVDMLRIYHKPSKPRMQPRGNEDSEIQFRSITELYESGVKLKLSSSKNCLDIHYSDGNLEIPHIKCTDFALVLGNMVAFEQCYCLKERYITDYVNLMARLVRSPGDVELLIQHGILSNKLANKQAVDNFCDLGRESVFHDSKFYYRRLCEDLDAYCKVSWHKWRATLTHEYFKNPFSVIAAFLFFLIAILDLVDRATKILERFSVTAYFLLGVLVMIASLYSVTTLSHKYLRKTWTTFFVAAAFCLLAVSIFDLKDRTWLCKNP